MSLLKRIFGKDGPASESANELPKLKKALLECLGERVNPRQNPVFVKAHWYGFGNYPLAPSHIPRSNGLPPEQFHGLWLFEACPSCQKYRPAFHFPTFYHHDTRDWKSFQDDHKKSPEYIAAYVLSLNAYTAKCKAQLAEYVAQKAAGNPKFESYCPHCLSVGRL